jgi:hypothetical protein
MSDKISSLPRQLISLTYAFGSGIAPEFQKPNDLTIKKAGFETTQRRLICYSLDENYCFCLFWLISKLLLHFKVNNLKELEPKIGITLVELVDSYITYSLTEESRKHTFNTDAFLNLLGRRFPDYGAAFLKHQIYAISLYLDIMTHTILSLSYYFPETPFSCPLEVYAIEDIKWLDEKVIEIIQDYFDNNATVL